MSPFACDRAETTTAPSSVRRQSSCVPTSAAASCAPAAITVCSIPYVPRSSVSSSAGARAPGCCSAAFTVATTSSSATLDQRQGCPDAEEDETGGARPPDPDPVEPEPAEAVDRRRHPEIQRDDRPDRRRQP